MARPAPRSYEHHARMVPGDHRAGLLFLVAAAVLSVMPVVRQRLSLAGGAGLPALARRVLDEKVDAPRPIKRPIRDWQADFQRV